MSNLEDADMNAILRNPAMSIRRCRPDEYASIGRLIVSAYAGLKGMPQPDEQPYYYAMLEDVGRRDRNPAISVFLAVSEYDEPIGSIDFIDDMTQYGSGGSAGGVRNAVGIRLLAVRPEWRGYGVGKALTRYCIELARMLGKERVVLHTTRVMQTAWGMYERMGFVRFPEIDFAQGSLEVFGFELALRRRA
jgi:GNAT superfamily N-acetyltransferase